MVVRKYYRIICDDGLWSYRDLFLWLIRLCLEDINVKLFLW